MINLTDAEREKFATYLEQQASMDQDIITQLEKMTDPTMQAMAKKFRTEMMAAKIVAAKLRSIETQSV